MIAVTSSSFLAIPPPCLLSCTFTSADMLKPSPSNPHLNLVRNGKGLRVYSSKPGVQFVSVHLKRSPVIGAATQKAPNIFTSELCQTQLLVLHASSGSCAGGRARAPRGICASRQAWRRAGLRGVLRRGKTEGTLRHREFRVVTVTPTKQ